MAYTLYVNDDLLYDSFPINEDDLRIYSPTLDLDKEGGSLSFILPKGHPLWNLQSTRHSGALFTSSLDQIILLQDGVWVWEGFPSEYDQDLVGNYRVTCSGAINLLKNIVIPLGNPVNVTINVGEDKSAFLERAIKAFTTAIVGRYNDRIDEFSTRFSMDLSYQKIFCNASSIIDVADGIPPYHFSRICNFENCYDALQKRIIDDFGGRFYLTKVNGNLVINYQLKPCPLEGASIYLGKNLLDYNISETFELATSVIPRGESYNENHPGDSKWWLRDERPAFYDIDQKADYRWAKGEYTKDVKGRMYPTGGSRIFLPNVPENIPIAQKYGMRDVILELDNVVAKYPVKRPNYNIPFPDWRAGVKYTVGDCVWHTYPTPDPHTGEYNDFLYVVLKSHTSVAGSLEPERDRGVYYDQIDDPWHDAMYGWPSYYQEHYFNTNSYSYKKGDRFFYKDGDELNIYEVLQDHTSRANLSPPGLFTSYYALFAKNIESVTWLSKKDYLGESPNWDTADTQVADWCYVEDYCKALWILGIDYLTNQQFDSLKLDVEASKISFDGEEELDIMACIGCAIPVSADIFGGDMKPYEVTGVSIPLDDDASARIILGGEDINITKLVRKR